MVFVLNVHMSYKSRKCLIIDAVPIGGSVGLGGILVSSISYANCSQVLSEKPNTDYSSILIYKCSNTHSGQPLVSDYLSKTPNIFPVKRLIVGNSLKRTNSR